jgi:uncharacterized protein (TIGR02147 family)
MTKLLNIFEFSDYRVYLKQWLETAKQEENFTLGRLAKIAGVHATFLSHVLRGSKHLSLEQATLISQQLGHTRLERDYFFVLIQLDRAGTVALKNYWLEKRRMLEVEKNKLSQRFEAHHELTDQQRMTFYSNWLYLAVWASTAIDDGLPLHKIAERFRVGPDMCEEILRFLVETGVCYEADGVFKMGKVHVHVANESPFVLKHHSNWRMKALQRMDVREQSELFFTAPMSISRKDFALIRERLNALVKEIVDIAKASVSEDLFCLNIDFFEAKF